MARNRKTQSASVRIGPLVTVVLLCLFFAVAGIGYVWQVKKIHTLGEQVKERETRLAELQQENKRRSDHLSAQSSPVAIEARVKKLNLGLVQPPMTHIVRLPDAVPQAEPDQPRPQLNAGGLEPERPL